MDLPGYQKNIEHQTIKNIEINQLLHKVQKPFFGQPPVTLQMSFAFFSFVEEGGEEDFRYVLTWV